MVHVTDNASDGSKLYRVALLDCNRRVMWSSDRKTLSKAGKIKRKLRRLGVPAYVIPPGFEVNPVP